MDGYDTVSGIPMGLPSRDARTDVVLAALVPFTPMPSVRCFFENQLLERIASLTATILGPGLARHTLGPASGFPWDTDIPARFMPWA